MTFHLIQHYFSIYRPELWTLVHDRFGKAVHWVLSLKLPSQSLQKNNLPLVNVTNILFVQFRDPSQFSFSRHSSRLSAGTTTRINLDDKKFLREISGFRCGVAKAITLLGCGLLVAYRRLGTCRSHLQTAWPLKTRPTCYPAASVTNYQKTPCKIGEEGRPPEILKLFWT